MRKGYQYFRRRGPILSAWAWLKRELSDDNTRIATYFVLAWYLLVAMEFWL